MRSSLAVAVAFVTLGVLPAAALGGAEQIVDSWSDEPTPWELVDPCTGAELVGVGVESGVARVTDLGPQGHHVRVRAEGTVRLYDGATYVGTWTYGVHFGDQYPPDGQGAVAFRAVGPIEYADGSSAVIQVHSHAVFEKGDLVKRRFEKAVCAG